jgi:hypothetical protein
MEIGCGRILGLRVALSQKEEMIAASFSHSFIERRNRPRAANEEGKDHRWEEHKISERERREARREGGQILHASFFFLGGL